MVKIYQKIFILLFCGLIYASGQANYGLFFHISVPFPQDKSLGEDLNRFTMETLSSEKYTLAPSGEIEDLLVQYGFWKNRFKITLSKDLQNILKKRKIDYLLIMGLKRNPDHFLIQARILPVSEEEEEFTFIDRSKDWQEGKEKWASFLRDTCLVHKQEVPVDQPEKKLPDPKETPIEQPKEVETPKETPIEQPKEVETPKETPIEQPKEVEMPKEIPIKQPVKKVYSQKITLNEEDGWFKEKMPQGMKRHKIPGEYNWIKDGSTMVYVSEGDFFRGKDKKSDPEQAKDELPAGKITLPAYYIDKYEVSNEQYAHFLSMVKRVADDAGNKYIDLESEECGIVRDGDSFQAKYSMLDYPVIKVSWYGAMAYSQWAGKTLPSEVQWEKAARGGASIPDWKAQIPFLRFLSNPLPERIYPWGDDEISFPFYRANGSDSKDGYLYLSPVDTFEGLGDSPYGCTQMAGNVWEWCNSPYTKNHEETIEGDNVARVCKGGSWGSDIFSLRCSVRYGVEPSKTYNDLGFRCALIVEK